MNSTQLTAVTSLVKAVGTVIKEAGAVPSGHLYAILSAHLTEHQFNQLIESFKKAGKVAERGNLLYWIEPVQHPEVPLN